jgi:hypothetical protein
MHETKVRETYKEKLRPTPMHVRTLDEVLWRCRTRSNTALEQRSTAWRRCHILITRAQQEAELQGLRAAFPAYAALHRHVRHDVLARLDHAYQAFFQCVATGEQPGFPRFQGRHRSHSCTDTEYGYTEYGYTEYGYTEYGNGARLDNGCLVLAKIGRSTIDWSRPLGGCAQDGHHFQRGGRLVHLLLVCRGARPTATAHRGRDGRRRGAAGVLRHGGRRHGGRRHGGRPARREPAPSSARRARTAEHELPSTNFAKRSGGCLGA